MKRSESFNAKPAIEKFKDYSLGSVKVTEIHISSRSYIDTYEGARVKREEFEEGS